MRFKGACSALTAIAALAGCGSFDIMRQLEDQQRAIATTGSCVAPAAGPSGEPIAAKAVRDRLAVAVANPLFGSHAVSGTLAERLLAYGAAAQAHPLALALDASPSLGDPIVGVQTAFIRDPVGTREQYLANLGPLGQHELVRLAANIFLTARAHNLGKIGVANEADAHEAVVKLRNNSSNLSNAAVNSFVTSTTSKLVSTSGLAGGPASPSAFEKLLEYYSAYTSSAGFILRDGSKLSRPTQIAPASGPDPAVISAEKVLLEFLADYFLATPIFKGTSQDGRSTIYYPAGTAVVPTASIIVDTLPISTSADCGVNADKSRAINLIAGLAADEMSALASPLIESFQGFSLGIAVAGVNLSVTPQTVQGAAKTFVEVATRRAVYALGTDVFIAARTADLNAFLQTVLTAVKTRQGGAS